MGNTASESGIPYALKDYIDLVEWTGCITRTKFHAHQNSGSSKKAIC